MAANIDNGVIIGALGSVFTDGPASPAPVVPPTGMIIAAIQFITPNKPTALVAENPAKFFNTEEAANNLGAGSETVDEGSGGIQLSGGTHQFPAGMTIYGRWTSATFAADSTGGVICYFGY